MLEHWPPRVANWLPKSDGILFFSALGPIQVQHLLLAWGRLNFSFSNSALTPSVKPSGPVSTFASIGMLDLALTSSVKWV
jgi:hypothetical protein